MRCCRGCAMWSPCLNPKTPTPGNQQTRSSHKQGPLLFLGGHSTVKSSSTQQTYLGSTATLEAGHKQKHKKKTTNQKEMTRAGAQSAFGEWVTMLCCVLAEPCLTHGPVLCCAVL